MPILAVLLLALSAAASAAQEPYQPPPDFWKQFKLTIERHLGRPYVWGACGLKSFDCSGFLWRVMWENRIFVKRTTARKFYMSLPAADNKSQFDFGNVVFFNSLKHCGIVNGRSSFYHAETSKGTTLSPFNAYWRARVCGFRRIPSPK